MVQPALPGSLLDRTQDNISLIDEWGTFTYVNDAAERILGFAPDELVGTNAFDYVHPDDRARARHAFTLTIESDGFAEEVIEFRHRTADGSWLWLESRMTNLHDSALDGYVVSSRDVTDRVEAQRERDETASYLREIASVTSEVLWMFDGDFSELLFVNPAYGDVYGKPTAELEGDTKTFLNAIHPDDVPVVEEAMDALSEGNAVDVEYRVNPDEGYRNWVWVQAEPITVDGEVVRVTGFSRDITDRRRRECQLVVMDNLLRHNLRNDLNVIFGQTELIESVSPDASEHTAVIRRVGEQLLETAEKEREIIDLITKRRGTERIELDECVARVHDRHPGISIEISSLEPLSVEGRKELRLALIELLENAIPHADVDEPEVSVALRQTADFAEIVVRDNHSPIPPVEADVLTGDHDMTNVYHSTGLGFWLIYWSVELSDGSIAMTSGDGGNEITIRLPRVAD